MMHSTDTIAAIRTLADAFKFDTIEQMIESDELQYYATTNKLSLDQITPLIATAINA